MTTPIVNSPGLFYDPIGNLKYYHDYWKIVTFSDLSYIKPHIDTLQKVLENSKQICNAHRSTKVKTDCYNVLNPLESLFSNVQNKYMSLSHITDNENSHKVKRSAWFGIGGPILKQLFGSLDEDDAKAFTDAINAVQDDQRHLASISKENIHIMSSTIASFNSTISKLNANENVLNKNIQNLGKILDTISENTNKLEVVTHLSMIFSALESSLMLLNFNLRDLNDAILFGKQNIVHPSVLSPTQLYNELNSKNNDVILGLPLHLSLDNIHKIIDVAEISSFISNEKLIFAIKIPLVPSLVEYNLYHIYSLPTPHDINKPNTFALITPSAKFLAITQDKLLYSMLQDLSECKVINSNYYLCKLVNVQSSVGNPICETIILTEHVKRIPDSCSYKLILGEIDLWQRLVNNKWIYVQSDVTKLSINCNGNLEDHDIIGTGILRLPKHCKAYHKLLQFIPAQEFETKIYIPHPDFNIIVDDCCSKAKLNNSMPYLTPVKLSHINLDYLQYASHKLNQANDELSKIENQPYHIKYSHYFSILTTLLSITVFSFFSYKLYKCFCNNNKRNKSCCVKIINNCVTKPSTSIRARSSIEMSNFDTESTDSGTPRRNLELL